MINLDEYRIVDLSPRMIARLKKLDGTIEPGNKDVTGLPWVLEEGVARYDNTKYTWVGGTTGDEDWPYRLSGHFGSHTEGGKGHLDHWEGVPDTMLGLWEYPLESFIGPAAVCNLSGLEPGQAIKPEHLSHVQDGDIVLMWSSYRGAEQPHLPVETSRWLVSKKIKMIGFEMPCVAWESDYQAPQPNNSPTHRTFLTNNIGITYPLANMAALKKDRVFYIGFPLSVERLDGCWIRAIVLEEK